MQWLRVCPFDVETGFGSEAQFCPPKVTTDSIGDDLGLRRRYDSGKMHSTVLGHNSAAARADLSGLRFLLWWLWW